jgi:hypothetical protein
MPVFETGAFSHSATCPTEAKANSTDEHKQSTDEHGQDNSVVVRCSVRVFRGLQLIVIASVWRFAVPEPHAWL